MTAQMHRQIYTLAYDKNQIMLDLFNYYLLSPDFKKTIVDSSSQTFHFNNLVPFFIRDPASPHSRISAGRLISCVLLTTRDAWTTADWDWSRSCTVCMNASNTSPCRLCASFPLTSASFIRMRRQSHSISEDQMLNVSIMRVFVHHPQLMS